MSCEECKEVQEKGYTPYTGQMAYTYVRIGNGNVLIAGCDKHLSELLHKLRS